MVNKHKDWFLIYIHSERHNDNMKLSIRWDYENVHLWPNELTAFNVSKGEGRNLLDKLGFFFAVGGKSLSGGTSGMQYVIAVYKCWEVHFKKSYYRKFCVKCYII